MGKADLPDSIPFGFKISCAPLSSMFSILPNKHSVTCFSSCARVCYANILRSPR
jgi:hypothetical protein